MPPRIQPKTLQGISLKGVASVINKLCVDMEHTYGGRKCSASQNTLMSVKMYLSTVQPLLNDVCKEILDSCFNRNALLPKRRMLRNVVGDKYLLLELLMCDKIRTLYLRDLDSSNDCFSDSVFWKNQLLKLNNVVELDIMKVRLTDESFQAIGDVCTNLRVISITSDLRFASMRSLLHILKCRELRDTRIDFRYWEEYSQCEYTKTLIRGLPKLEHFHNWLQCNFSQGISLPTPVTSMREIQIHSVNSSELAAIIRMCPDLKDVALGVRDYDEHGRPDYEEKAKVLDTLAESSLQLHTLALNSLAFSRAMTRLITSKCAANLTSLNLSEWEGRRISVNDIHTIGISCHEITDLRISEMYCDVIERAMYIHSHSRNMEEQTFLTTPRMFVHLEVLWLQSNVEWDPRILPLILRNANNIAHISLRDMFKPSVTSLDMLSELLDANALRQLESLILYAESYGEETYLIPLSIASIERLLDCCPKLTELDLECPMGYETIQYLRGLQSDMPKENFDISLKFNPFCLFV